MRRRDWLKGVAATVATIPVPTAVLAAVKPEPLTPLPTEPGAEALASPADLEETSRVIEEARKSAESLSNFVRQATGHLQAREQAVDAAYTAMLEARLNMQKWDKRVLQATSSARDSFVFKRALPGNLYGPPRFVARYGVEADRHVYADRSVQAARAEYEKAREQYFRAQYAYYAALSGRNQATSVLRKKSLPVLDHRPPEVIALRPMAQDDHGNHFEVISDEEAALLNARRMRLEAMGSKGLKFDAVEASKEYAHSLVDRWEGVGGDELGEILHDLFADFDWEKPQPSVDFDKEQLHRLIDEWDPAADAGEEIIARVRRLVQDA